MRPTRPHPRWIVAAHLALVALVCAAVPHCAAAQPVPRAACPLPRVVTAAPLSGQPADVAVTEVASLTMQPVTVTDSAGLRCLGYAERVPNSKRWRAWRTESGGFVRVPAKTADSAWSARADAVRAVIATRPAPVVVVEPTPAPLTRDSLLGWPVRRVLDSIALSAAMRTTMRMFVAAAVPALDALAATEGVKWEGNYYDRALSLYALCSATGLPRLCARADSQAVAYRDTYLATTLPPYSPSAHWSLLEGLTRHAERTGDAASRAAVAHAANQLWVSHVNAQRGGWDSDPRVEARTLLAQLLAARVAPTDVAASAYLSDPTWGAHADSVLVRLLARQRADGVWDFGAWLCHAQLNYQAAMVHDALVAAHGSPAIPAARRPAIVDAVRRSAAYLWTTQRWPTGGFSYASGSCTTPVGQLDPGPAGDLTGLFAGAWTWLTEQTGDPVWAARGDTLAAEGVAAIYWPGTKQANQGLYFWRHFGRR